MVRLPPQYETGVKNPKANPDCRPWPQVPMSHPTCTLCPDIDSYVGLMHILLPWRTTTGSKISEMDGEVCLKVDVRRARTPPGCMRCSVHKQQAAAMLEAGEISKEDYDKWRYHYPEFDRTQKDKDAIPRTQQYHGGSFKDEK